MKKSFLFLGFVLLCLIISLSCSADRSEPILNMFNDTKAKQVKYRALKEIVVKDDGLESELHFISKDGKFIKVVYTESKIWNGVALCDSNGNTLSSLENALYTSTGKGPGCGVWDVVAAELNGDKEYDYYVQLRCTGNGLAQVSQCILFLSKNGTYKEVHFTTYVSGADHLVSLYGDGRSFLIVEDLIDYEITLPPLDKDEFPGITKEELGTDDEEMLMSWYRMQQPYFQVFYPLEINGQALREYVKEDRRFPLFVSYFKGSKWYLGGETKLLTPAQKSEIWNSNYMGYADVKIRYPEFAR